jgi:hypothetical protein
MIVWPSARRSTRHIKPFDQRSCRLRAVHVDGGVVIDSNVPTANLIWEAKGLIP